MHIKTGDRIVFLGDSITEQRLYTTYVEAYLATRHPELEATFLNAGWGGDSVGSCLDRLERDVLPLRPSLVVLCLGMNDGEYRPWEAAIGERFERGLRNIIAQLTAIGARVAVLSPGIIDPDRSAALAEIDYLGCLRRLADIAMAVAASTGCPAFDLHAWMLAVQQRAKAAEPGFCMIPDAVHPDEAGHLVMAHAVLELLDVQHAVRNDVVVQGNAVVAMGGAAVDLHVSDLPIHIEPAARRVLPFLPFREAYDPNRLRITGSIDGTIQLDHGRRRQRLPAATMLEGIPLSDLAGSAPGAFAGEALQFVRDRSQLFFLAWRRMALGGSRPRWLSTLRDRQAAACNAMDRELRILSAEPAHRRFQAHLALAPVAGETVTDGARISWWSLLGPLPGDPQADHLNGEAAFSREPRPDGRWQRTMLDVLDPGNNLQTALGTATHCVVYALCAIDSPNRQAVEVRIGSDDGCCVWHDGRLLLDNIALHRGCTPDEDRAAITLPAGRSHLLVKVAQYDGAWGLCVALHGHAQPVAALAS